jgi:hypothetical protein
MKNVTLFIILLLVGIATPLYAQPSQFEYPCSNFDFPSSNPSSELFTIVTFEGANLVAGDFVVAIDSDGFIVGRNRISVGEGCLGSDPANHQSLLNLTIYEDQGGGACANGWGANPGEQLTLVVQTNGSFYEIPGTYTFPSNGSPSFQPDASGGDFCSVVNTALSDVYAPFPVTLESFSGYTVNSSKAVQLEWVSSQEEEVSHYEVEYSGNGIDWERIGRVEAAGNSTERIAYDFLDNGDLNVENFYRLKMVDRDGSSEHSGIVIVTINDNGNRGVSVFPNPISTESDQLSIQLKGLWNEDEPIVGELFDVQGRSLQQYKNLRTGTSALGLPLGTRKGLYLLRVTQTNAVFTHKISLQ